MRNYVDEFLDVKAVEDGVAINTIKAYRNDINQFIDIISPFPVQSITTEDIESYLNKLSQNNYSPKTFSRKISCIREFYKFMQSERIISENPANKIRTPRIGKSLPFFLTIEEVKKMCDVAQKEQAFPWLRMSVMIKLMYSSGLRVSELVSLPENAINYDLSQILICGKGSKERVVPVSKEVIGDVLEYVEYRKQAIGNRKNTWMFPSLRSLSGHMTRDGFFKNLKKLAIKAGISPQKVHPHVLRHSFATRLVNNSADLRSIQKMLGHENVATTEIYTHITTDKLVDEVRKYHPLAHKSEK